MTPRTFSAVTTAMIFAAAATMAAQSAGKMNSMDKMDHASMKKDSYTGCLQTGDKPGTYALDHATMAGPMMKDMPKAKGAANGEAMKTDGAAMDMKNDGMASDMWMAVMSKNVDLSKHIGHTVTITGSGAAPMAMSKDSMPMGKDSTMGKNAAKPMAKSGGKAMDMGTFTVETLAMVSSSCAK